MVECGSISQPPSINNLTIWGIVTYIVMIVVGGSSIFGVYDALHFNDSFYSIILLVGSCFGVAGLVLVIISFVKNNPTYMKLGVVCFLISVIVHIALLILYIIKGDFNLPNVLQLALDIFMCVLFYLQSNGFSGAAATATAAAATT